MIASGVASTGGLAAMALKKLGATDGRRQDPPDERRATSSLTPGSS